MDIKVRMKKVRIESLKKASKKTLNSIVQTLPIILGVLMFIALVTTFVSKDVYSMIFTKNPVVDPLIGALFGSFAAGNALTSYVIGGELLTRGVTLVAITSFIVSWVTVGVVQFPAESMMLGKRFAVVRNVVSFLMSIVIAILTVFVLGFL